MLFMLIAKPTVVGAATIYFCSVAGWYFSGQAEFVSVEPVYIAADKVFTYAVLGASLLEINTLAFADDFRSNDFEAIGAQRLGDS